MRKTLKQKIDESLLEMNELQKKHDELLAKYNAEEQKKRTHRLCKRGGYVEKYLPEIIGLTDKQFYSYVEKVMLTDDARFILMAISEEPETPTVPPTDVATAQGGENAALKPSEPTAQANPAPAQKSANAPHGGGTEGRTNGGNAANRTS
jgi:predicted nuclease with TOPRIM domain